MLGVLTWDIRRVRRLDFVLARRGRQLGRRVRRVGAVRMSPRSVQWQRRDSVREVRAIDVCLHRGSLGVHARRRWVLRGLDWCVRQGRLRARLVLGRGSVGVHVVRGGAVFCRGRFNELRACEWGILRRDGCRYGRVDLRVGAVLGVGRESVRAVRDGNGERCGLLHVHSVERGVHRAQCRGIHARDGVVADDGWR